MRKEHGVSLFFAVNFQFEVKFACNGYDEIILECLCLLINIVTEFQIYAFVITAQRNV